MTTRSAPDAPDAASVGASETPSPARGRRRILHHLDGGPAPDLILRFLAVAALLFSALVAVRFSGQPLVDIHAFRQTQTALTAYWMLKEGFSLAYQTPVAGAPWAIPFEFPIYQALVASISGVTGLDLAVVGRLVSYSFLVACGWPAFAISRRLRLAPAVPLVFCALLWTSPLNVYWGRTVLIETTALFFSFASIPFFVDLVRRDGGARSAVLFVSFATLGILQKSTTCGPVLLVLAVAGPIAVLRGDGLNRRSLGWLLLLGAAVAVPLGIGLGWSAYTDAVKMLNPFGAQLTGRALWGWNFGTIAQRLRPETWRVIVWERSFLWSAGGFGGAAVLLAPLLVRRHLARYLPVLTSSLALFLVPPAVFTNLHFVHEYYQVACTLFLVGTLAIVIGGWMGEFAGGRSLALLATLLIMLLNLRLFSSSYGVVVARSLDQLDPRSLQSYRVGRYLRERTPPGTGIAVFGQGYSSEVAYQAQRKALTVPPWFRGYREAWKAPERFLGGLRLSAVTVCPVPHEFPSVADAMERWRPATGWEAPVNVSGCAVFLPQAGARTSRQEALPPGRPSAGPSVPIPGPPL